MITDKVIKSICRYILNLFKSPIQILNEYYPVNTLNSTDEECIKSDFKKVISNINERSET